MWFHKHQDNHKREEQRKKEAEEKLSSSSWSSAAVALDRAVVYEERYAEEVEGRPEISITARADKTGERKKEEGEGREGRRDRD